MIVTGRNAKDELIEAADLVTEMGRSSILPRAERQGATGREFKRGQDTGADVVGTGSDVGKSPGLCRAFTRRGRASRPLSHRTCRTMLPLRSTAVKLAGLRRCKQSVRSASHTDMNPVLLKPQSETGAQVVVQGKVWAWRGAEYQAIKSQLM